MVDTPIPPLASTCAISILHREHIGAIQRMDPGQIRAVLRLMKVQETALGGDEVKILMREIGIEAAQMASLYAPAIPNWWSGFE